jgi:hypothetical protein
MGWKSMFGMESLDTLPVPADAKGPTSIRQSVISWACGTGRPRTARVKNKAKAKAKAKPDGGVVAAAAKSKPAQGTR